MTYIIIAIVIVLIVVIVGMITLHKHVDKTTKEMMVRFPMVNNKENVFDSKQDVHSSKKLP
jgi:competence protein ComGC